MSVAAAGSGTVSTAVRTKLCFHYAYDDKGRLEAQYQPGQNGGLTEMVYDRLQRPVMRRTPKENSAGQWEVTFYDHSGRVIATSLYSNNSSRAAWQDVFDAYTGATYSTTDLKYYIVSDAGVGQYPPENGIAGNSLMSYTWYDDYSVVDPNNAIFNEVESAMGFSGMVPFPAALLPVRSKRTQGLITGTKVRILPAPGVDTATTGDWIRTWNYYDDKGQVIYLESKDLYHNNALHKHMTGTEYDFTGKVILSKHVFTNNRSKGGILSHTEMTHNSYDAVTGQLVRADHKMDDAAWNVLATYQYDDLGRMSREVLGDHGETRDYDYNIRGQLTGINGHYAETGDKGIQSKTFGESLKYDYGFTNPKYDGKIAGMVWRGSGGTDANALAYGYTYDPAGRLTNANFREGEDQNGMAMTPASWNNDVMDYTLSNLTYDKNSNILTKDMRGPGYTSGMGSTPMTIDQLSYSYTAGSNRLSSVTDDVTTNYQDGDFQDGNISGSDYAYDADGNLSKDLNKGISSVVYTYFDKPQTITFSNGSYIRYSYTAAGNKIQGLVRAGDNNKKTDYIGNFVYQNDSLQYASTAVGRTVWNDDTVKEEYFVKDHLGNVRSIIDIYQYPILSYLASYEIASAQLEELFFDDVDGIRDDKPGSTDPEDQMAGRLNGAEPDHRVGTSILVKVMAGDKVQINADNYYDGTYNPRDDQPVRPDDILSSIISTLTGGAGGLGESESHAPELVPKLFNPDNYNQINDLLQEDVDPNRPKAFLNYVLFDQNMRVVRTFTGAWQANGDGGWQTIGNDAPMDIPVNGYLAVYLSNASSITCESCMNSEGDVYFDKLKIKFSRGHLKQETHYYPFGLPMAAIGSSAVGMTPNRQKYQSNEYITDAGLNWMSFGARQYDPQLGRFLSVDPMASAGGQDMLSPYQAMGNNPVSMTDPLGLAPPQKLVAQEKPTTATSLAAMFMRLSGTTLNEVLSGADDPLHQSFWYNHRIGKDGKLYTLVLDMDGNILSVTLYGDNKNSGKVPKNEEKSSNKDNGGQNSSNGIVQLAPAQTDEFNGFWGQAKWWWTGGISGKGQYSSDGKLMGLAPIMGTPPLEGSFNGIKLAKLAEEGEEILQITTRIGRDGNAAEVMFKNGSKMDINAARVKEWVPNLHPNAPFGALQKVKFGDFLPGSKGFKRAPTQEEIDFLNNLFK
jgi:RHS repeat-associated protein